MLISTRRILLQFLDRLPFYKINFNEWTSCRRTAPLSSLFFLGGVFRTVSTALESAGSFFRQGKCLNVKPSLLCSLSVDPKRYLTDVYFLASLTPFPLLNSAPFTRMWCQWGFYFIFLMGATTGTTKSDRCECPAARMAVDVDQLLEINTVDQLQWRSETMRPFISMGIEHTDLVSRTRAADIEKLRFGLICYVDIMYVML
jgi:hypothetical protein